MISFIFIRSVYQVHGVVSTGVNIFVPGALPMFRQDRNDHDRVKVLRAEAAKTKPIVGSALKVTNLGMGGVLGASKKSLLTQHIMKQSGHRKVRVYFRTSL